MRKVRLASATGVPAGLGVTTKPPAGTICPVGPIMDRMLAPVKLLAWMSRSNVTSIEPEVLFRTSSLWTVIDQLLRTPLLTNDPEAEFWICSVQVPLRPLPKSTPSGDAGL